jgi:secreted trypsin-like serine protease
MRGQRRLAAILGGAFLALALCLPAIASASGGARASVIGGAPATIEQLPSLAYLEGGSGRHAFSCTGTVVAPRVVLTAGHCVEDIETGGFSQPAEYKVATNIANPKLSQPENVFDVVATHVFPTFDPGVIHGDAALLILSRPTTAPPLALAGPGEAALYEGGAPVAVAGWGLTLPQNRQTPANLQTGGMVVQKPSSCGSRVRSYYQEFSPTAQLCVLSPPANKTGTCFGDSGGPAIGTRADGVPVELGVISVVGPECTTRMPNVMTRVDYVSSWVTGWIAATEAGAAPPLVAASLPSMTELGADQFAVYTLLDAFGKRFASASKLSGNCRRTSKSRFSCEIVWIARHTVYAGTITPFYVLREQTTTWDSHFLVRWAPVRCVNDNFQGGGCRVHSKRG